MIPQGVQVFVALDPVDMRSSFDRLSGIAQEQIGYEARGGALFPHLYGVLPVNKALWVRELPVGFGGTHVFPSEVTG